MSAPPVIVDTDVWSLVYSGDRSRREQHEQRRNWRALLLGRTVVIATQTRAEVLAGLLALGESRRTTIRKQLDNTSTIPVDETVIEHFAQLTYACRQRGDALGDKVHTGDRWIAATAMALDAPLLSGDHIFDNDPDLILLGRDT